MAGGLLKRVAQIALEEESVEGTAETLVDADATMLVYDPSFTLSPQRTPRNPSRSSLSQLASVIGMKPATMSFRTELKGSGSASTAPAWDRALRCCGLAKTAVSSIAIGAVTGGPYQPGETVTGAGGGTGRVVGECRNGDAKLYYVPLSGTLTTEVLTGGTSGATATASAGPTADQGFEWRLASSSVPSATVGMYQDGILHQMYGARGNVQIQLKAGEWGSLAFDLSGVYLSTTDEDAFAPTFETPIPIAFLDCAIDLHGLAAQFSAIDLNLNNTIAERTDAGAAAGILSYLITGRAPSGTIDPEMTLVADHDFFGRFAAGTTGRLYVELPSTSAGQKITVASPRVQYASIGDGERSGIAVANVGFDLLTASVSTGDDELQIGMIQGG